ncbi:hypothetical protein K6119_16260 [Paracrocinitomix mangrovi]|uniref:hypothetical protein n=1 Tax=Paracrocinitomix mangrovi TaxID=2862509 RepID=UPI001C8D16F8|nr:hypothetical protein [Paracrocinitomix mangrovi]UKN01283.1 hypothetical protein K6119_16260 [Paracrocinitomix mangrovi]
MENENPKDEQKALKLYFVTNLLNVLFYIYLLARFLNIGDTRNLTKGIHLYFIIGLILLVTYIRNQAKKAGGDMPNPIISNKTAKILHFSATGIFLLGIFLTVAKLKFGVFISLLCIPLEIAAIAVSFKPFNSSQDKEDLLDTDLD